MEEEEKEKEPIQHWYLRGYLGSLEGKMGNGEMVWSYFLLCCYVIFKNNRKQTHILFTILLLLKLFLDYVEIRGANFYVSTSLNNSAVSLLIDFKILFHFTWITVKPLHGTRCCALWGWQQVFCWGENPSSFICFSSLP